MSDWDDFTKKIYRDALKKKHAALSKRHKLLTEQLEAVNEQLYQLDPVVDSKIRRMD